MNVQPKIFDIIHIRTIKFTCDVIETIKRHSSYSKNSCDTDTSYSTSSESDESSHGKVPFWESLSKEGIGGYRKNVPFLVVPFLAQLLLCTILAREIA